MAASKSTTDDDGQTAQFLTFYVSDQVFGMGISSVREIIQYGNLTPVPLMPAFVRGVINLRGAVVPVVDLQCRIGRGSATIGKKTCIVIFDLQREDERVQIGLLVDAVSEVVDIEGSQIEPPPAFGNQVRRDLIQGMGKLKGRFVILLDPEKALDVDEMADLIDHAQSRTEFA